MLSRYWNGDWWCHKLHSYYVPRSVMPQIDEADLPALCEWASSRGVGVATVTLTADQLHFHQRVNLHRVATMPQAIYDKPLLISRDGYVLDGNHRAVAHKQRGEPARCIQLDASFLCAMRLLFSFPRTYTYGDGLAHASF
jgi:hypothetical protein